MANSIVPTSEPLVDQATGKSITCFHVRNAFVCERIDHTRWGTKLLVSEEEYRPTNMVVNYITPDSATGWSASSITARGWSASNNNALGPVEPLLFDIENPKGVMTLIPNDSRSLARKTKYRIKKKATGYVLKVYNPDESPANYQDTVVEAKYAMDVGVFMTEWAEEKRRLETTFNPGVFLTDCTNEGRLMEKGSFKMTAIQHSQAGAPVPYRLKIPEFLPQHIQSRVDKRKKINEREETFEK